MLAMITTLSMGESQFKTGAFTLSNYIMNLF